MNELIINENNFDDIKHIDEDGNEFWYARELMPLLEYNKWDNFHNVIKKAMISCNESGNNIKDWFPDVRKPIITGKGKIEYIKDYELSRYACYLIAQNGDSRKKAIALAQTYFATQTRKMEILESEYNLLTEDEKRLYRRKKVRDGNKILYRIASSKGVKNFDKFTNAGYMGLYGGETADDIAKRKGLRYREEILDHMGSSELGANIFRISMTDELLKKQKDRDENKATNTHYVVGTAIRNTIKELGGTMPEDLPTPKESIKALKERGNDKYE